LTVCEQTATMYCFLTDLLTRPAWNCPADLRRRLNDAQVLTTVLVAARFVGGNLLLGQRYIK